MNLRPILAAVAGVLLLFAGWRAYGGAGLAIVATGLVTWMLLWVTRMIHVLKKAADRPKGAACDGHDQLAGRPPLG
ncbi:hypothetical protein [Caenimonas koreensis]|uniref:hypothetical protein n=1 Tax=Caenimonas koreensis TaxID=367474 RepID=UPI0037840C2B